MAVTAAGRCGPTGAKVAPAQSNPNGLDLSGAADRQRRATRAREANPKRLVEAKKSELSFSGDSNLEQNGAATERRRCSTPARRQQQSLPSAISKQTNTATDKSTRLPPASERKRLTRGEAPSTATTDSKFVPHRPEAGRSENNLRHWKGAAGPLDDSSIGTRSRRTLVGLSPVCKSLLQLNGAVVAGPPRGGSRARQVTHRQPVALCQSGAEVPARIKQVLAASRVAAAASQVLQRRPRATPSEPASVSRKPSATAAARAVLLSKTAPKRALSSNQLASRPNERPKVAKTTASPAITNSRVRQGLLFARRQCQLAPPFNSAENLSTQPISCRVSHLATTRAHLQSLDKAITRTAKSCRVPARAAHQPARAAAGPPQVISKTERLISHPGASTRKLVAADTTKQSLGVALHLRRRWSSLESSNQDEDDDDLSSPSSSSSSTLSSNDSTCLLLTPSQALDYLAPAATGRSLINQQAAKGERHIGRRRGSSLQLRANQTPRPKPQQATRRTSEQSDGTRQTEPATAAEGQCESELAVDEIPLICGLEQHRQLESDIEPNCEHDNKSQARGTDCEPHDIVDIVVKQPKNDWHFVTQFTPRDESRRGSLTHDLLGRSGCEYRALDNPQLVSDNPSSNDTRGSHQVIPLPLVSQSSRDKPLAESNTGECSRASDQIDGLRPIAGDRDQSLADPRAATAAASLVALAPVENQDKMMISIDHGDNNETSQRWPIREEANINNNYQIDPEDISDLTTAQHQPLGPLQTINCEQRKKQQSKENTEDIDNDLKVAPFATQKQTPPHKTALIPIRQEPIHDYYDLEPRPFARGKFAQVKRCVKIDTKECFAAKCIKKRRRLVDIRHEILLEIEALKLSSRTEHIVKLYEVYETPNEMILILEMASGGELQRVLDDEESISEAMVCKMVRQILEGLIHLHDDQIVHLDLKPQNLLLTKPFPNGDVKLCDFGISRRISECEIREICGTPDYTAPEVLQYDPISLNTDMWSLGVVTYVLLSGYSPFGSENKQQTFCNITTCSLDFPSELFENVSQDAIDFVRKLIVLEPSQRLTSRQALNHRWFSQSG